MTLWISHRGESADAPENTISAFHRAMELDADGMETDIRSTKDGVLVCSHDPDTGRTGNVKKTVSESTFDELSAVDVRCGKDAYPGSRIARFADALAALRPGKKFFVEIKENDERSLAALRNALADAKNLDPAQIVVISFHADMVAASPRYLPGIPALLLVWIEPDGQGGTKPAHDEIFAELERTHAAGLDIHYDPVCVTPGFIQKLHRLGYFLAVWTVDGEEQARACLEANVDAITSNRAGTLKKLFRPL